MNFRFNFDRYKYMHARLYRPCRKQECRMYMEKSLNYVHQREYSTNIKRVMIATDYEK